MVTAMSERPRQDESRAASRSAGAMPLSIHDLTVAYHRKPVLWDVTFDVPAGKLVGIVGPNGAGKSTLIKAVLDLMPRASGRVARIRQALPAESASGRLRAAARERGLGLSRERAGRGGDGALRQDRLVPAGPRRSIGERHMQALERVGIADLAHRQISQLSGGQQQRTFLARALVQDADLYLMDEPFAAVDAATEQAIVRDPAGPEKSRQDGGRRPSRSADGARVLRPRGSAEHAGGRRMVRRSEVFTTENLQKTYGGRLTLLDEVSEAMRREGQSL